MLHFKETIEFKKVKLKELCQGDIFVLEYSLSTAGSFQNILSSGLTHFKMMTDKIEETDEFQDFLVVDLKDGRLEGYSPHAEVIPVDITISSEDIKPQTEEV